MRPAQMPSSDRGVSGLRRPSASGESSAVSLAALAETHLYPGRLSIVGQPVRDTTRFMNSGDNFEQTQERNRTHDLAQSAPIISPTFSAFFHVRTSAGDRRISGLTQ